MTYRGEIHHGTVVLDEPIPLPEGTAVECTVNELTFRRASGEPTSSSRLPEDERPVWERIASVAESLPEHVIADLPVDGASEHDHYLYGTPKQSP